MTEKEISGGHLDGKDSHDLSSLAVSTRKHNGFFELIRSDITKLYDVTSGKPPRIITKKVVLRWDGARYVEAPEAR